MDTKQLKALITAAGLSYADCVEKRDLVERALQAQQAHNVSRAGEIADSQFWPLEAK